MTAGDDNLLKLCELANGKELLRLEGHDGAMFAVAFSQDGQELISGGDANVATIWQAAGLAQVAQWREAEEVFARSVAQAQAQATREQEHGKGGLTTTIAPLTVTSYDELGEIRHWLVLSPIPFEGRLAQGPLGTEQNLSEAQLEARAGYRSDLAVCCSILAQGWVAEA